MELNFIKKKDNLIRTDMIGGNILELCGDKNAVIYRAYDYDPEKNTVCEISPDIKKYNFITVLNCIYGIENFYFATYRTEGENARISVYEYDFEDKDSKCIFEFSEDPEVIARDNKIKIFILNSTHVIVQTEIFTPEESDSLMGAISFKLSLYNIESRQLSAIEVADFKNNGISTIIPVSENRILIKCGYSFIEDARFNMLSEKEALIESIYLTSSSQLIADIFLNQTTGNMKLLDTAYFEKCITTPKVKDNYVYYELVDIPNKSVDMNFINSKTLERITYRREDSKNEQLIAPFVINNIPYIMTQKGNTEKFLNLSSGLTDMEFIDEEFICSVGSIMIFNKMRRGREHMRIYSFPRLSMIFEERYSFGSVCRKDDEYYIYI